MTYQIAMVRTRTNLYKQTAFVALALFVYVYFTDTGNNNSSGSPEQGKTHFPVAIVLGTTIPCGLLIMLLVIVLSICLCRRRREDKDKFSAFSLAFLESQLSSEANPIYCALELESLGLPEGLNFPRENLTFIEDLGEGHFGKVLSQIS